MHCDTLLIILFIYKKFFKRLKLNNYDFTPNTS